MYGLFLRDLAVMARIGAHDFERLAPQRLIINVALAMDDAPAGDSLAAVTDYDFVRLAVDRILAEGHIDLQETLCRRILEACRAQPRVAAVRVTTEKPDVYADTRAVGCRMVWVGEGQDQAQAAAALG